MKKFMVKRTLKAQERKTKGRRIFQNNKGSSEMVAVIVLIIIVLVIGAVVFLPSLTSYIRDVILPGLKSATDNLFNFKG